MEDFKPANTFYEELINCITGQKKKTKKSKKQQNKQLKYKFNQRLTK